LGARLVPHGLRDDAGLLREMRRVRMIEIVRVLEGVREHEARIGLAINVDHAVEVLLIELERIVAAIEELDLGLAAGLHARERRAGFLPGELAFAALAEGHAHDLDAIALLHVQRDGATRAPDEISRMCGDHQSGLLLGHFQLAPALLRHPEARAKRASSACARALRRTPIEPAVARRAKAGRMMARILRGSATALPRTSG